MPSAMSRPTWRRRSSWSSSASSRGSNGSVRARSGRGSAGYEIPHATEEDYAWASLILGRSLLGQRVADILALVRRLANEGTAVCYSTHYLPEVEALGASVALLVDGAIIARGQVSSLVAAHGECAVELVFDGPAPTLDGSNVAQVGASILRLATDEPAAATADALASLGDHVNRLVSIEIVRPSLESVFLALTGRRYRTHDDASEEASVL